MAKKILVIKLGALGDFVLATGRLFAIRKRFKDARIDLLTGSGLVQMAQQMEIFDNVFIDDRNKFDIFLWYRVCKKIIADGNYDIVFDMQGSIRTLKKYQPLSNFFAGKKLNWQRSFGKYVDEVEELPATLEFCKGDEKNFHLLPEKYVLLIPGCSPSNEHKRWSKEKYANIAKKLAKENIYSVVLGTKAEQIEIDFIANSTKYAINFMGKASLLDIPNVAKRAMCVIGNDSGPTHMASLVGTKTIVLFCERTKNSANNFENVINLFGGNINDITEQEVLEKIK